MKQFSALMRTILVVIGLMAAFAPAAFADDTATKIQWSQVDPADRLVTSDALGNYGAQISAWLYQDAQTTGVYVVAEVTDTMYDGLKAHGTVDWRLKSGAMSHTFGMWVADGQKQLFRTPIRNWTYYNAIFTSAFRDGASWLTGWLVFFYPWGWSYY